MLTVPRDARFVDENSEDAAPFRLRLLFDRVFALARDIKTLAASTLRAKRRALERDLDAILIVPTACPLTRDLLAKVGRARTQLLTFCDFPGEVEPTNNVSERALRPCVIQRKVANGYRAKWAAAFQAGVRTTVDSARLAAEAPAEPTGADAIFRRDGSFSMGCVTIFRRLPNPRRRSNLRAPQVSRLNREKTGGQHPQNPRQPANTDRARPQRLDGLGVTAASSRGERFACQPTPAD